MSDDVGFPDHDGLADSVLDSGATTTDEQIADDNDRMAPDDEPEDTRSVQVEYDGGWSAGTPDHDSSG